jgi:transcriptional regulator with XRE-family HTH domain
MTSEIGRRLKNLRKRARLSSRAVAERLDIPASTYQKYEDRYQRPYLPLHLVAKLVNALRAEGISVDEIWTLAEPSQVSSFLEAWAARSASAQQPAPTPEAQTNWLPTSDGRRHYVRWTPISASLSLDGEKLPCVIRDISPGGACVLAEAAAKLHEAADVLLELAGYGPVPAQVARQQGNEIGLSFAPQAEETRTIADWLTPMRATMH